MKVLKFVGIVYVLFWVLSLDYARLLGLGEINIPHLIIVIVGYKIFKKMFGGFFTGFRRGLNGGASMSKSRV